MGIEYFSTARQNIILITDQIYLKVNQKHLKSTKFIYPSSFILPF